MAATELRKLFLRQFMQEILRHAARHVQANGGENEQEALSRTSPTETSDEMSPEKEVLRKNTRASLRLTPPANKPAMQQRPLPPSSGGLHAPLPYKVPTIVLQRRAPQPRVYLAPAKESWLVNLQSLSRIQPLLADPTITTIECPGPGIPIMIARGTYVQSTPVHFTTDEIKKIIEEISERAKIPLDASGIFKAAIGNIIITAVLSEFVGTRFVIQKRSRAPPSPMPSAPLRR